MSNAFVKSVFDEGPFTPTQISGAIGEFRENHIALDEQMNALVKKFPNQWASMCKSGLRIAPTLDALLSKMVGERCVI